MTKLFFRVGKLHTNQIEEVEYKSIIMDLFREYCNVNISPESINLVVNREYGGGFKTFSFVTLPDDVDAHSVIETMNEQVTEDGYELGVSVAKDKKQEGGFKPRKRW